MNLVNNVQNSPPFPFSEISPAAGKKNLGGAFPFEAASGSPRRLPQQPLPQSYNSERGAQFRHTRAHPGRDDPPCGSLPQIAQARRQPAGVHCHCHARAQNAACGHLFGSSKSHRRPGQGPGKGGTIRAADQKGVCPVERDHRAFSALREHLEPDARQSRHH